jgi:hypothetical protein
MTKTLNPIWWDASHDFAWDHVKLAMRRGLGARQTGDLATIPPTGLPTFDEFETAYRFGYSARLKFEMELSDCDSSQIDLAKEWRTMNPAREEMWQQDCIAILFGWNYGVDEWQSSSSHAGDKPGGRAYEQMEETVTKPIRSGVAGL